MPTKLKRYYGQKHIHYITCSCFHRRQYLGTAHSRDVFCQILEEVRRKFDGTVVGYVVMPEHFHLLLTEPLVGDVSGMMQILKQRVSRRLHGRKRRVKNQLGLFDTPKGEAFWNARSYDFNVWSKKKLVEKLRYIHRNPVKRGLVSSPEMWKWSSYRFYALGEKGTVRIDSVDW